jgi:hypothetical protein
MTHNEAVFASNEQRRLTSSWYCERCPDTSIVHRSEYCETCGMNTCHKVSFNRKLLCIKCNP